ncbi:MAG: hypothetical protein ACPGUC_06710 [Gammaproteobacteria bacterium]
MLDFFKPRSDPDRDLAVEIDLEAGVLRRCPLCHDITFRESGLAHLARAGDLLDARLQGADRDRVKPLLRSVCDAYGVLCTCEDSG